MHHIYVYSKIKLLHRNHCGVISSTDQQKRMKNVKASSSFERFIHNISPQLKICCILILYTNSFFSLDSRLRLSNYLLSFSVTIRYFDHSHLSTWVEVLKFGKMHIFARFQRKMDKESINSTTTSCLRCLHIFDLYHLFTWREIISSHNIPNYNNFRKWLQEIAYGNRFDISTKGFRRPPQ